MKADFSRGFNPDRKRDKEYRRVLLQQGRVLLDSDAAAMVDASDTILRHQSHDLGTEAGGHERGYMLTAGRLYAVFRDLDNVFDPTGAGTPLVRRLDYTARFRKRFPSLRLDTVLPGSPAPAEPFSVRIKLFTPHPRTEPIVLWMRRDVIVGGAQPPAVTGDFLADGDGNLFTHASGAFVPPPTFTRFVFNPPAAGSGDIEELVITFGELLDRVFIGMIESDQTATDESFWIAPGRFHVKGLLVENLVDTPYEEQVRPEPAGGLVLGTNVAIAYLEGWERMITALHDPGIRERALSQGLDTSVRTQAIGQVKTLILPTSPSSPTADDIHKAFANRFVPDGTLVVSTVAATAVSSPCDVAPEEGFTGRENLLYHFEVHAIDGNDVTFKFSRQGGSELFLVEAVDFGSPPDQFNVFVKPELGLRDGDIVEVLSDTVELGDESAAEIVDIPDNPQFIPPQRLVGSLAVLKAVTSNQPGLDKFALRNIDDAEQNILPDAGLYPPGEDIRLRRWDERFEVTLPNPDPVQIGDGLEVTVAGAFEVGDWWQIEARLLPPAPGFGEKQLRHGPERLFSPLAIIVDDDDRPEISEWLDEPFVSAAKASADTIHFDDAAARFVGFVDEDTNTLQAIIDHLLTKGVGRRIVDIITRVFDEDQILGVWQMSVGDTVVPDPPGPLPTGSYSFGDFNGPDAIQQAVAFVRAVVGGGNPWTLRLFVKRGTYVIDSAAVNTTGPIVLQAGERLILEGEGPGTDTAPTATIKPGAVITCLGTTTPCLDAVGENSLIEFGNIALIGGATGTTLGPGLGRTAGEIRVTGSRLKNRTIVLRGSTSTTQGPNSAVVLDSEIIATTGSSTTDSQLVRVVFPAGNATCPTALFERCRVVVPTENGFAAVTSASTPVRFEGLVVKNSSIRLGGSSTNITLLTTNVNSGLFAVLVAGFSTGDTLSIGDVVFEDCVVDAGTAAQSAIFLHLPSGNEPAGVLRASINNVVIRGGRWTLHSDVMRNAMVYVGNQNFLTNAADTKIANLIVERVEMGWASTNTIRRVATTFNAAHAFVFTADRVRVRDFTIFGAVATPLPATGTGTPPGELVVLGTARTAIDGIRIENIALGGGHDLQPVDRIRLYSSNAGVAASNINVIGSGDVATSGIIELRPAGPSNPVGRRTVLTGCRVEQNGIGAGYFKDNELDVDFVACFAEGCFSGIRATQHTGVTPSVLTVQGGRFMGNQVAGIWISFRSNLVTVMVEGTTCTGTINGPGLLIDVAQVDLGAGLVDAFTDWGQRGPVVVDNRVFGNGNTGQEQIIIGDVDVNNIGGVCIGNYCRGSGDGIIMVLVPTASSGTYFMRGLTADNVTPWASRSRSQGLQAENSQMAFNHATWRSIDV